MRWLPTLLLLTACDDLNRPLGHPHSPRPLNDQSSSAPSGGAGADGGATGSDDATAPAPAPTITPQPGDIQI